MPLISGRKLFFYFGVFVLATLVANGICYFYYSPAIQIENHEKFTDLKNITSNHNPHGDEGYGNITIDQNGFNNQSKFPIEDSRIVCIGSSQTEAQHVGSNENFVSIINQEYPEAKAYNVGISASTFASTFFRITPLKEKFPNAHVFIFEINNMPSLEDLKRMEKILSENNVPEKDISWKNGNFILKAMGTIPLCRLLWKQYDHQRKNADSKPVKKECFDCESYEYYLRRVLSLGKKKAGNTDIVIFYLARTKLDKNGEIEISEDDGQNAIFKKACKDIGINYLDMAEPFTESYRREHVLPYGFLNSRIGTGHLNIYGHRIIADSLEKILEDGAYIR